MIVLNVKNLSKSYGKHAVFSNLSCTFSGNILGIAGKNGSGKSTLLLCLAGLMKPSAGTVSWHQDENEIPEKKLNKKIGYAAPYIELYEGLTCRENLRFLLKLNREHTGDLDIDSYLNLFDAGNYSEKYYGELSTGQRQRVKLAASSLQKPDILCLDEPGSNLDPEGKELVKNIIENFRDTDKMVILASNLSEELDICGKIINLDGGGMAHGV